MPSPTTHAVLSASSAHRWLACPPSAQLNATGESTTSEAAEQGTAAHALAEWNLRKLLGEKVRKPRRSPYEDDEMLEHASDYAAFVMEQASALEDPLVLVEHMVDFSDVVPGGFGTADALILSDKVVHVCDLKYGSGVLVEAEDNPQLKLYALGTLQEFGLLYSNVETIQLSIFQPRRANVSTWETTVDALTDWANQVVAPRATLADAGEGNYAAGEWCVFCKIKATCRARAEENLRTVRECFSPAPELSDSEVAEVVARTGEFTKWLKDVGKHALIQALDGKTYPGLKLVAGRSTRKFTDENKAIAAARAAGYSDEELFDKKLLGIPALSKLMGDDFDSVLGELVHKPQGAPVIAPESDKRPDYEITSAWDAFSHITD